MKRKMLSVLDPRGQPSGIFGRRVERGADMMDIMNPVLQPKLRLENLTSLQMAPRLDRLDHKRVYLIDIGFAGSREFMEEMKNWFSSHIPSVKITIRSKDGTVFSDSPELWAEAKQNADAVIMGVGG